MTLSRAMKKFWFTLLVASLAMAQDAPKTMNRITVQLDGPEIPQDSFVRKPKPSTERAAAIVASKKLPIPSIIFTAS
jgi:hypothetical protein